MHLPRLKEAQLVRAGLLGVRKVDTLRGVARDPPTGHGQVEHAGDEEDHVLDRLWSEAAALEVCHERRDVLPPELGHRPITEERPDVVLHVPRVVGDRAVLEPSGPSGLVGGPEVGDGLAGLAASTRGLLRGLGHQQTELGRRRP